MLDSTLHVSTQEIKDLYLFAIVVVLLILDVIFMLPPTIISSSILKRKEREIISDVSYKMIHCMAVQILFFRMGICLK